MSATQPLLSETRETGSLAQGQLRFGFLDGLRGLAALMVVVFHVVLVAVPLAQFHTHWSHGETARLVHWLVLTNFLVTGYGPEAVVVFIVLSGYCLMLPVVREPSKLLKGGIRGFVSRRAKRILPAYYAAVALGLLLVGLIPPMHQTKEIAWAANLPVFSWGNILSHIFLIHNWTPWIYRINPPFWSIAVEWQIYFVFAFCLLFIYRWAGIPAAALTAVGLGLTATYTVPSLQISYTGLPAASLSQPWMLGCFGFGMAAACVRADSKRHWKPLAIALAVIFLVLRFHGKVSVLHALPGGPQWFSDYLVAGAAACLILHCVQMASRKDRHSSALAVLSSPSAVFVGSFSYSLYLVHIYVLWLLEVLFLRLRLSPNADIGGLIFIGIPAAIGFAYIFHLAFERPFMPGHPRTSHQAEIAAIRSPAP